MKTRVWDRLGNGGVRFTELGFGTAPIGNLYRAIPDHEADATLQRASDLVLDRVRRIEAICAAHRVRLVDAAFQFVLQHPSVVSVIPGGQGVAEVEANAQAAAATVPADLWADLKAAGLLRSDAPIREDAGTSLA